MIFASVFRARFRGFRVVDLLALTVLLSLALGSYAFKTFAGVQGADQAGLQSQIDQEDKRIRLLHAEIAHLEDPGRIERLSTQYLGVQRIDQKHEITAEQLPQIATQGIQGPAPKGALP